MLRQSPSHGAEERAVGCALREPLRCDQSEAGRKNRPFEQLSPWLQYKLPFHDMIGEP
jgi:hypothetical protein